LKTNLERQSLPAVACVCNGVPTLWTIKCLHKAGESMLAQELTQTACWPMAIVAGPVGEPMLARDRHQDGQHYSRTKMVKT